MCAQDTFPQQQTEDGPSSRQIVLLPNNTPHNGRWAHLSVVREGLASLQRGGICRVGVGPRLRYGCIVLASLAAASHLYASPPPPSLVLSRSPSRESDGELFKTHHKAKPPLAPCARPPLPGLARCAGAVVGSPLSDEALPSHGLPTAACSKAAVVIRLLLVVVPAAVKNQSDTHKQTHTHTFVRGKTKKSRN